MNDAVAVLECSAAECGVSGTQMTAMLPQTQGVSYAASDAGAHHLNGLDTKPGPVSLGRQLLY